LNESAGSIKRLPVKATVVKDKQGAYIRGQHVNPSLKDNKSKEYYKFTDDDITSVKTLGEEDINDGVTKGVLIAETPKGRYFIKPTEGEKYASGYSLMREGVTLNDKATGRALDGREVNALQFKHENIREKYKGSLADREVMAARLAEELGFDHLPPAEIKRLTDQDGLVTRDVRELYKDKYEHIFSRPELRRHTKDGV
jgi:hypothetical protein